MKDHILLVEDEQRIADFVCAGLAERGLEVHHCSDGNSGFAQATTGKFDVILLDLMLGDVSTISRIPALCAEQPEARLIMLTGYASIPATVQALRSGAVNLLAKPVGVREVVAAMEEEAADSRETVSDVSHLSHMGLKRLEWEHIQRVLAEHDGNVSAAARSLGMHRRTLQRKLEKRAPR